jgi:cobalt-zinc-cadmium efflux system membrane fusion protein
MNFERGVPVLNRGEQIRILVVAVVAVALVVAAVVAVRHGCSRSRKSRSPARRRSPADRRQLASLTIDAARGDDGIERTGATGQIAVDETRSTPVFLPYSGQILKVFVENGAHVATGDPLLRIRTGDIVDARNALFSAEAQRSAARRKCAWRRKTPRAPNRSITMPVALSKTCSRHAATSSMRSQPCGSLIGGRGRAYKLVVFGKRRKKSRREAARDIAGLHAETNLRAPIGGVVVTRSVASGQYVTSGGFSPHSSSPTCRKSGWWRKWLKPMRRAYSSAIMSRLPRPRCRAANSMR